MSYDSLPSNISSISISQADKDVRTYFTNYFNRIVDISSGQHDVILSYFEKFTNNKVAAEALASAIIYTAQNQRQDPIQVLEYFTTLEVGKLNSYLCMFLNLNRVGTSLLGISNRQVRNKYVKRNIIS